MAANASSRRPLKHTQPNNTNHFYNAIRRTPCGNFTYVCDFNICSKKTLSKRLCRHRIYFNAGQAFQTPNLFSDATRTCYTRYRSNELRSECSRERVYICRARVTQHAVTMLMKQELHRSTQVRLTVITTTWD